MRTVRMASDKLDLDQVIEIARNEAVLLLTSDGEEFLVSPADDFAREVELLRSSASFQAFLEKRASYGDCTSIEEIEAEIENEMAVLSAPNPGVAKSGREE